MRTLAPCSNVVALLLTVTITGCVGQIDGDGTGGAAPADTSAVDYHRQQPVSLVALGASTTAGYTFDPSLLGLPGDPVYAENPPIPFVELVLELFRRTEVDTVNLAVPGSTSSQILADQLPSAVAALSSGGPAVITVEAGGNDLRAFQVEYGPYCTSSSPDYDLNRCGYGLATTLTTIANNLSTILGTLRAVAPDATIIVSTQYNSLAGNTAYGTPCADPETLQLANLALEGDGSAASMGITGLNPIIRAIAANPAIDATVADIAGATASGDPRYFSGDCTHLTGRRDAIDIEAGAYSVHLDPDYWGLGYTTLGATYFGVLVL